MRPSVLLCQAIGDGRASGSASSWLGSLRHAESPLAPFHWELEFPEVFNRPNPGFDAFVGNPPFGGKNNVSAATLPTSWIRRVGSSREPRQCGPGGPLLSAGVRPCSGRRDVRAHRHEHDWPGRHAFNRASLDLRARRRDLCRPQARQWPGIAAVMVSIVHVIHGQSPQPPISMARGQGGHGVSVPPWGQQDPVRLAENENRSFVGSYVLGMGSPLTTRTARPSPLNSRNGRVSAANPRNAEVIRPYIGGEEVNAGPRQHTTDTSSTSSRQARAVSCIMAGTDGDSGREGKARAERPERRSRKTLLVAVHRPGPVLSKAMQASRTCLSSRK